MHQSWICYNEMIAKNLLLPLEYFSSEEFLSISIERS
jgi:hypothetical protein